MFSCSNWGWCATLTPGITDSTTASGTPSPDEFSDSTSPLATPSPHEISNSTSPTGTPSPESSDSRGSSYPKPGSDRQDEMGKNALSQGFYGGSSDAARSTESLFLEQNLKTARTSLEKLNFARSVKKHRTSSSRKQNEQQQTHRNLNTELTQKFFDSNTNKILGKSITIKNPFYNKVYTPHAKGKILPSPKETVLGRKLRMRQKPHVHEDRLKHFKPALRSIQAPRITTGAQQACPACDGGKGMVCASSSDSAPSTKIILGSIDNSTYNRATVSSLPF